MKGVIIRLEYIREPVEYTNGKIVSPFYQQQQQKEPQLFIQKIKKETLCTKDKRIGLRENFCLKQ